MKNKSSEKMLRAKRLALKRKFYGKKIKKYVPLLLVAALISACDPFRGRETVGEYVDDATITASVKSEIFQHPALKASQIHVETLQSTVQLSGFVDSLREKNAAGKAAQAVNGVKAVKNNLVVRRKNY